MTKDIQHMLDQAFEAGRAAEREMARISALVSGPANPSPIGEKSATRAPKAAGVARGVRKAGQRTKGVKDAIIKMIGAREEGVTITDVVNQLGFKERSVRAALFALKKTSRAHSVGKRWYVYAKAKMEANPLT